jgi:hypothetical protein
MKTSSRPKAAHFAAAVERPPHLSLPLFVHSQLFPTLFHHSMKTSSRPKAAHFAAAVERSLYFAVAVVCSLLIATGNRPQK